MLGGFTDEIKKAASQSRCRCKCLLTWGFFRKWGENDFFVKSELPRGEFAIYRFVVYLFKSVRFGQLFEG